MRRREQHLVVVGDVLLDRDLCGHVDRVCPDAPAPVLDVDDTCEGPGGAGLAALLCRTPGTRVTLIAPFADDEPGRHLRAALDAAGIDVVPLAQSGTTRVKTRLRARSHSVARVDEGGPASPAGGELPARAADVVRTADVVLVADYGAGTTAHAGLRELLSARTGGRRPGLVVWDPHPRGADPVPGCAVVTPNLSEATRAVGDDATPAELARTLRARWQVQAVCVTAGGEGAWLATASAEPFFAPTTADATGDSCGAGDRFAATLAQQLARGASPAEATTAAVARATDWVRAGGTETYRAGSHAPDPTPQASAVVADVRARGGTVVATGGCFDVLHPGHLASLQAARALGDALVVLLNSDDSVRRLKGPGRPVQTVGDRAEVLRALAGVDEVVVFDGDDPREALATIRPDVWAKGGDYDASSMPEAELVRSWGGRVVLLPYLRGRSTTGLLRSHHRREAGTHSG
ncbi:PfkB family carbohydrate kinase [Luteipulveratus halotolerans]|uniref:D-glycero-beta-D-manno-heptose 1-phosphate adenylyltransferase n=1 Tax=Luteipulveratus halotolerans TaxID=1631356 RepID=A0A0L6CLN2_9MICO|nr:PfkB family carbohydrate kinase [Luteipulveratus halotolerans]KNX38701.1 hypothetical protein VV01_18645 [Luteipulveratus halotolerans]